MRIKRRNRALEPVAPPTEPEVEHLFTPLVCVKPDGAGWTVDIDWADSYRYSVDGRPGGGEEIQSEDEERAAHALDELLRLGVLPRGGGVARIGGEGRG
jgi:hypothetical protein